MPNLLVSYENNPTFVRVDFDADVVGVDDVDVGTRRFQFGLAQVGPAIDVLVAEKDQCPVQVGPGSNVVHVDGDEVRVFGFQIILRRRCQVNQVNLKKLKEFCKIVSRNNVIYQLQHWLRLFI